MPLLGHIVLITIAVPQNLAVGIHLTDGHVTTIYSHSSPGSSFTNLDFWYLLHLLSGPGAGRSLLESVTRQVSGSNSEGRTRVAERPDQKPCPQFRLPRLTTVVALGERARSPRSSASPS